MAFTHLSTVVSFVMPTLEVGIGRATRCGCAAALCACATTPRDTFWATGAAGRAATRAPANRLERTPVGARTVDTMLEQTLAILAVRRGEGRGRAKREGVAVSAPEERIFFLLNAVRSRVSSESSSRSAPRPCPGPSQRSLYAYIHAHSVLFVRLDIAPRKPVSGFKKAGLPWRGPAALAGAPRTL